MEITSRTKISKLIEFNADVIDVIASINSNFKKLKNPVLRKLLAARVTIENASKIGGVSIEEFLKKLEPLGFTYQIDKEENSQLINEDMNENFEIKNETIVDLDVRPDLAQGNDPFGKIMAAVAILKEGQILKITNTFEPFPIINVLKQKGFISRVENPSNSLYYIYFKKVSIDTSSQKDEMAYSESLKGNFDEVYESFGNHTVEMDVRDLEMPQPMVQILEKLKDIPEGNCLFVHHKKVPQFLLPQLKERGYVYLTKEIDEDNVKMLIYKDKR